MDRAFERKGHRIYQTTVNNCNAMALMVEISVKNMLENMILCAPLTESTL